jgi:hypothetical protein
MKLNIKAHTEVQILLNIVRNAMTKTLPRKMYIVFSVLLQLTLHKVYLFIF